MLGVSRRRWVELKNGRASSRRRATWLRHFPFRQTDRRSNSAVGGKIIAGGPGRFHRDGRLLGQNSKIFLDAARTDGHRRVRLSRWTRSGEPSPRSRSDRSQKRRWRALQVGRLGKRGSFNASGRKSAGVHKSRGGLQSASATTARSGIFSAAATPVRGNPQQAAPANRARAPGRAPATRANYGSLSPAAPRCWAWRR